MSFRTLGLLLFGVLSLPAADRLDVFFVAVGSDTYAREKPGTHGFQSLQSAATNSAERVAELLQIGGARFGVKLVSTTDRFVTRHDIENVIALLKAQAGRTAPRNPFLIFYFAGHGISEGVAWNHFSIPGDFLSRKEPSELSIEDLTASTIHAGVLVDGLEKLGIPFAVLLDTCSEGRREDFQYSVLSSNVQENLRQIATVIRFQNEFHQPNPVLFSAQPGKVVATVEDPRAPQQASLGPLARRITLLLDKAMQTRTPVTLDEVLAKLTSRTFDSGTQPAITHFEGLKRGSSIVFYSAGSPGRVEGLEGTGTTASICCGKRATAKPAPLVVTRASVTVEGAAGEFLTGGRRLMFVAPRSKFSVIDSGDGRISLEIENDPGSAWTLSFSTPDGTRFVARRYRTAQRFDFADSGHPGLEISGDAHACNQVKGEFTVNTAIYGEDELLRRFSSGFTQYCDDQPVPLRGSIDISLSPHR